MKKNLITIFTPTYNRGYTIERLYNSLKNQRNQNFEWIVIDDGSTDNTEEIFLKILNEDNKFNIRYLKQKNGGKHRAINRALDLASSELFFIVDSDDYLIEEATDKVENWVKKLTFKNKENIIGIAGEKGYSITEGLDKRNKKQQPYIECTNFERKKFGITGDKAEVFFTEILKRFKFPEIVGENFLTEAVVWNRIASQGFKIRWYSEIIYICDYLEDGLTTAGRKIFLKNPEGYLLYVNEIQRYKKVSLRKKYGLRALYYNDLKFEYSDKKIMNNLKINFLQFLLVKFISRRVKRSIK